MGNDFRGFSGAKLVLENNIITKFDSDENRIKLEYERLRSFKTKYLKVVRVWGFDGSSYKMEYINGKTLNHCVLSDADIEKLKLYFKENKISKKVFNESLIPEKRKDELIKFMKSWEYFEQENHGDMGSANVIKTSNDLFLIDMTEYKFKTRAWDFAQLFFTCNNENQNKLKVLFKYYDEQFLAFLKMCELLCYGDDWAMREYEQIRKKYF